LPDPALPQPGNDAIEEKKQCRQASHNPTSPKCLSRNVRSLGIWFTRGSVGIDIHFIDL
jgi:hypothetical protein